MKATGLGRDWEWKLRERYWSGTDHCGTRTGKGMTAAGMGRDREQHTSPMQISNLYPCRALSDYYLRRGLGGDGLQRPEGGGRRGGGGLRRIGRGWGFGTCTMAAVTS